MAEKEESGISSLTLTITITDDKVIKMLYAAQKRRGMTLQQAAIEYIRYGVTQAARKGSKKQIIPENELPAWIPQQDWQNFLEHRRKINKPVKTQKMAEYAIGQLKALHEQGYDISLCIRQSIDLGYVGIFRLKEGYQSQNTSSYEYGGSNARSENGYKKPLNPDLLKSANNIFAEQQRTVYSNPSQKRKKPEEDARW